MQDGKPYVITWTQTYQGWIVQDTVEIEQELDLAQAQEILARIMAK